MIGTNLGTEVAGKFTAEIAISASNFSPRLAINFPFNTPPLATSTASNFNSIEYGNSGTMAIANCVVNSLGGDGIPASEAFTISMESTIRTSSFPSIFAVAFNCPTMAPSGVPGFTTNGK